MSKTIVEELYDVWDADAKMDKTAPDEEMLKIPQLHAKYIRMMSTYNMLAKKAESDYRALKRFKMDYYNGRLSKEDLQARGLQQFKFVLKQEASEYIDGDPDIIKAKEKIHLYNEIVSVCEKIIKELNNRVWELRQYMDWQKFLQGV